MEKFKINSQELIDSSGGNEDIFNAINAPDNHIFSLQRFADGDDTKSVSLRQTTGTTTLLADSLLGDILTPYTLGRSSNSSLLTATAAGSGTSISASGHTFLIAPLVEQVGTNVQSDVKLATYNLSYYNVSNSETRIAIQAYNVPIHTTTSTGSSEQAPYVGFAVVASDTGLYLSNPHATFNGDQYNQERSNSNPYSGTYVSGVWYSSTYLYPIASAAQGGRYPFLASTTGITYSVDLYDVVVSGTGVVASNDTLNAGTILGKYVYKEKQGSTRDIAFGKETPILFDEVAQNETEKYTLNGVGVSVIGSGATSQTNVASMTAAAYATAAGTPQAFTNLSYSSNVSLAFDITGKGSNTGVALNGYTYTSTNDSGTVTFSMSESSKFITLGLGNFGLSGIDSTTTYNLFNNASGTFAVAADSTFTLDVDGSRTGFAPVTFVAGGEGASVTAVYESSDVKISGDFAKISSAVPSSITKLQFTFAESSTALFNVGDNLDYTFSDTADGTNSYIKFGDNISSVSVFGAMSATGLGNATYTLGTTESFVLDGTTFKSSVADAAGTAAANQIFAINSSITLAATHSDTFKPNITTVSGYNTGSNVSIAGSVTIGTNSAKALSGLYFGNSTTSQVTVTLNGSHTTITGATEGFEVSQFSGTSLTLIGLQSQTFTANAGTFYLRDGGSGTTINGLTFSEDSDGFVSKLALGGDGSSMTIAGSVNLTGGSQTSMVYVLSGFAGSDSKIAINGIDFSGSGTSVQNTAENAYTLTNSGTSSLSAFTIGIGDDTDESGEPTSFTLLQASGAGLSTFVFGSESNTAITFAASDTSNGAFTSGANVVINSAWAPSNTLTVGGGSLHVVDNAASSSYKVLLGADGKVNGISNIDSGATIYSVASATSVITTGDGLFTFYTTSGTTQVASGVTGTGTQIFQIVGDADGVTFTMSDGWVTGITGISGTATVNVTDLTVSDSVLYWTKTYSTTSDQEWTAFENGFWRTNKYMGYIVAGSGTDLKQTVYAIESTTEKEHLAMTDYAKVGTSGNTFTLATGVFASATQLAFVNQGGAAFGASDTSGLLFGNLGSNTSNMGLLYTSGTSYLEIAEVKPTTAGSVTAITSISAISDTVSLTLGSLALRAGSEYGVSGTGVTFAVNSSTATVSAGGATALVGLVEGSNIIFGSTNTGTYNIYSGTTFGDSDNAPTLKGSLQIAASSSGVASGTFATDGVFSLGLSNNAAVTDTYVKGSGDSDLYINGTTFSLYGNSTTFTFGAGTTTASDSLTVSLGTVGIASSGALATTLLNLAAPAEDKGSASLLVDVFSYTGLSAAAFTISSASGTQLASVSSGLVQESVASDSKFFFNNSLFTAISENVQFNIGVSGTTAGAANTNTFVAGSATGVLNTAEDYKIAVLSDTFTMSSGSSVIMTYDSDAKYNANYDFTSGSGTATIKVSENGGTFALNDVWFKGDSTAATDIYVYTALTNSDVQLSLSLVAADSGTIKITDGMGVRYVPSATTVGETTNLTTFVFDPDGDGDMPTYTYTADATLTYSITKDTASGTGAVGDVYYITQAHRTLGEGESTTFKGFSYLSDTYTPIAGAQLGISIINGKVGDKGSETFISGSATFTQELNKAFYFDTNGDGKISANEVYTATSAIELGVYFSDSNTGTFYKASGTGVRLATGDEKFTYTMFDSDVYTVLANSQIQLTLDGTSSGTEAFSAGTGTYNVEVGKFFTLSNDVLSDSTLTGADSYTYTASVGGTLTLNLDGDSKTLVFDNTLAGTRSDEEATFTFDDNTYSRTSEHLTYFISGASETKGAVGFFYTGEGSRNINGSDTFEITHLTDTYIANAGLATIGVTSGAGNANAYSGTAVYTASNVEGSNTTFHFALGDGTAHLYSATKLTTLGITFEGTNTTLTSANAEGAGIRKLDGTDTFKLFETTFDVYTVQTGATYELSQLSVVDGKGSGTEVVSLGTGTLSLSADNPYFTLADAYLNGTGATPADSYTYTTFAAGSLTLGISGDSKTLVFDNTLAGTRSAASESFKFGANDYEYTTTSGELTYYISSASSSKVAAGTIFAGAGSRAFDSASDTFEVSYLSDTYKVFDGTLSIDINEGKGSDTFTSGSATYTLSSGGFHFAFEDADGAMKTYAYSATSQVELSAYFADSATGKLYSASGAGTRLTEGTETYKLLTDEYTLDSNATVKLTIQDVGKGSETYFTGAGTYNVTTGEGGYFHLSDKYLSDSSLVDAQSYTYTASAGGALILDIKDGSETVKFGTGLAGTRSDNSETFTFGGYEYTNYESKDLTYFISADSNASASGTFYTGAGTRSFEGSNLTKAGLVNFLSDTYTPYAGVVEISVTALEGSDTMTSGSATWTSVADNKYFHFVYDGATNTYTAGTDGVTLYGIVDSGSVTGLYNASGIGTRETAGTETYVINSLNSESYVIEQGANVQLTFSDTGKFNVYTDGTTKAQEDFISGVSTRSVEGDAGDQSTFTLSNLWLEKGAGSSDTNLYTFTADSATQLVLNITGKDSGTIVLLSGHGTRNVDQGGTFTLNPNDKLDKVYTYSVTEEASYGIDSNTKSAYGDFYSGAGSRTKLVDDQTIATLADYQSNTYTPYTGRVDLVVKGNSATETFVSGSATWVTTSNDGIFRFDYNGDSDISADEVYTALSTNTTLFASVVDGTVTSLVNAIGGGTRETTGSDTYSISDFSNDIYTMNSGATVTLTFSGTTTEFSTKGDEVFTKGEGSFTAASGTGSFTLNDKWLDGGDSEGTTLYTYTATNSDVVLNLTLNAKDSGTIAIGSGIGTREAGSGTFTFNAGNGAHEYTADSAIFFSIGQGNDAASGTFYSGAGTRGFDSDGGDSFKAYYLSDTYTVTDGIISVDVNANKGSDTFTSGSATWTSNANNQYFHFDYNGNTYNYTAIEDVSLSAYFADSATGKLYSASGAGTRLTDATETYKLLTDEYTLDSDATMQLNITNAETYSETLTKGAGTYSVASGTAFHVADNYLNGTNAEAQSYTYIALTAGALTLGIEGTSEKIAFSGGLGGTRKGSEETFEFGGNVYTSTATELAYYISADSSSTVAAGIIYAGTGNRTFDASASTETFNAYYLSDTYKVTQGTLSINLVDGKGEDSVTGGTATYTASADGDNKTFHFIGAYGTREYTATKESTFSVTFVDNDTNTTMVTASGAGTRSLDESTTFTLSALNNEEYTFNDGTAQITIDSLSSYSETAFGGTGYMTATGTFTAAFGADGAVNTEVTYAYTAFSGSAVLSATLTDGEATAQSLTSGMATRSGIAGSDTQFFANNYTYFIQDAANTTFVLSDENASVGAVGTLYDGFGTRKAETGDTWSVEGGNKYTAFSGDASFMNGYTAGEFGASDTLYNGTASNTYIVSAKFMFQGTEYNAGDSGATMALTATTGTVVEKLSQGSGRFEGSSSNTTFTWDENLYRVSGNAVLQLYAGCDTAVFESGTGVKEMHAGGEGQLGTFKYTDGNTYTVTSTDALLTAKGNESGADVNFESGTAKDELTAGQDFYFTLNDESHTYKAGADGATLGISGTNITGATPATPVFIDGTGLRDQDSATGVEFVFEEATYTSINDALTWTLELDKNTNNPYEHATGGVGTRKVADDGEFTYLSKLDNQTHTYTAASVLLELNLVDGAGTETLKQGSGTRDMETGDTFTLTPNNLNAEMTFTATDKGHYLLTAKQSEESGSGMLFMGYNVDLVEENILDGVGTGTAVSPFTYISKVTAQSETYTGEGVAFQVTVEGSANTATWFSGSATMTLDSDRIFFFNSPTDKTGYTYTSINATFTRTGETDEYISEGTAIRTLTAVNDAFTIIDGVSNTYTADTGATIQLTASGTTGAESFYAGTATFTGTSFNYEVNGASHTYTGAATLQGSVANGTFGGYIAADGAGTRPFDATETLAVGILGDTYTVASGELSLTLSTDNIGKESEVLTNGSGVFSATSTFHVSDYYLGNSNDSNSTVYTYSIYGDSGVTLALTVENGSETITNISGIGTREVQTSTFTFNSNDYTNANGVEYAISSTGVAEGYLFSGVGTRQTKEKGADTVFNSDTYTVDASATMVMTVTEGVGKEVMTAGTATFQASSGVFHFDLNGDGSISAAEVYTIVSETTMQIVFDGSTETQKLASITGTGTRAAVEGDAMSMTYQSDTYYAIAGSSTIVMTATGDPATASETLLNNTGYLVDNVSNGGVFHTSVTSGGDWYEYTAGTDVAITLDLSNNAQTFSINPDAIRTDDSATFVFSETTYTRTSDFATYSLTGSGTNLSTADLTDKLFAAEGYRTISGEAYTSSWNNNYNLTSGTYSITVASGLGTEALTAGTGIDAVSAGNTFNFGDSNTSFIANVEGAELTLTIENGEPAEALTKGAGGRTVDGTSTYIMVADAKVTIDGSTNATVSAEGNDGITTLTATALDTDTFTGGITKVEGGATSLTAALGNGGSLGINGKLFGAETAATFIADSALTSFNASGTSTISAEGNFVSANVTLGGKTVNISNDTDVAVFFSNNAINKLEKLSDGVTVTGAAGATKAVTDSSGTFVFSANNQTFTVHDDDKVTFQLDSNGLVTGISGIDADNNTPISIDIIDGTWTSTVSVTTAGQALTRNAEDGSWTDTAVTAQAYVVSVDSDSAWTIFAVDSAGDLNKIEDRTLGNVTSDANTINVTINNSISITDTAVYVVNRSADKVVNVNGAGTNISGIGITSETAAVQITTETSQFLAGNLVNNAFTSDTALGVADGNFSIDADGKMAVKAANSAAANVTMSGDDTVGLLATTDTSSFAVNGGTAVTLTIGDEDADKLGMFTAKLSDSVLTGLNPHGVYTGTAVVTTGTDASVSFSINDSAIVVTNDDGTMTLEIDTDTLVGISDISTAATINASALAGSELAINGDTDNKVTASTEPIKYNATQDKWLTGNADSIEGATGYLVSVNSANEIELYYTNATHTDTAKTTNVADYKAVLSDISMDNDDETVTYGDGIVINSSLDSDIKVSIAAGTNGITATVSDSGDRELTLVTESGNFTVNGQEIIPNAAINVTARGGDAVAATLNSDTTIEHDGMSLTAGSTSTVVFADVITLNNTAKVTNTNSTTAFDAKGTVTFDGIVVNAGDDSKRITEITSTMSPAGLRIDGNDLLVEGGDTIFTVDVATEATPVISGISGDATVTGALVEEAKVLTESTGTFRIGEGNAFTVIGDSEVALITSANSVTAIDSLDGTVVGNFTTEVGIDSDNTVKVLYDTEIVVAANGTQVTAINGVGSADTDVVIANAGGATVVNTDLNGSFYFGENGQHFTVADTDSQVSFLTSSLEGYVPSVTGVDSLSNGSIAFGQSASDFGINSQKVNLEVVNSDVTVSVADNSITSVLGLEGAVNGLAADVVVNVIDSDVTVNGAALQVNEGDSTNLTVYAAEGGFDTVEGLNTNAVVTTAKNAHVKTEEEGVFTFVGDTFTISGDDSVTFATDSDSRVINIGDFEGTLKSSTDQTTVNGAVVGTSNTDASIVSAGEGVSAVLGLNDGDSVTVPAGTAVEMPGSSDTDTATTLTVNGNEYNLAGDADGVSIQAGSGDIIAAITTLAADARLTVGAAGNYSVNDTVLPASIGAVIIGDAEGSAHVYSPSDIDITDNSTPNEIIEKITGEDVETAQDKYVENLDSDAVTGLAAVMESGDPAAIAAAANGNLQMSANNDSDSVQTLDFSGTTGIKKVTLESGAQDISFNDAGGNIAIVDESAADTKNINLGNGGDLAIVNSTEATLPVNITTGRGKDTIVTKGGRVRANLNAGGPAVLMPTGGTLELEGYNASRGQALQTTINNIFQSVRKNLIKLANDLITLPNGARISFGSNSSADEASDLGARVVNFRNIQGINTKVLYTYDQEGEKTIDLSTDNEDIVVKGNYTSVTDSGLTGGTTHKEGTAVIRTGSGNDTAIGGSGDTINLGSGNNKIFIDEYRDQLKDAGTTIEQTASIGRTEVDGFHAGYGDSDDVVKLDVSKAQVSYRNGGLTFTQDQATLVLNDVTTDENADAADLAESADGEESRIGTARSMQAKVEDINGDGGVIRLEVASLNSVVDVERTNELIAQVYRGENSGVNLGKFDENALINLNDGTGIFNGEDVLLSGFNKLQGGSVASTLMGNGNDNNTIVAGIGGSSIWGGGSSNDTLYGVGSDLEGVKSASSTFYFTRGDGKDEIKDFTFWNGGIEAEIADRLNVVTTPVSDVKTSGNDLVVSLNENDKLTIKDGLSKNIIVEYGEVFGEIQSLTAQVQTSNINVDDQANYYYATGKDASVNVNESLNSANADICLNNDGSFYGVNVNKTFAGDIKYLNASNYEGQTRLIGNNNDNVITASKGNSTMWGGDSASNDILVGGEGADTFFYGKNEGSDTIQRLDSNDTVNLYDVTLDDFAAPADVTSSSITATLKSGNVVTIQGTVTGGAGFRLQDGTTWALDSNRNWYQKN